MATRRKRETSGETGGADFDGVFEGPAESVEDATAPEEADDGGDDARRAEIAAELEAQRVRTAAESEQRRRLTEARTAVMRHALTQIAHRLNVPPGGDPAMCDQAIYELVAEGLAHGGRFPNLTPAGVEAARALRDS